MNRSQKVKEAQKEILKYRDVIDPKHTKALYVRLLEISLLPGRCTVEQVEEIEQIKQKAKSLYLAALISGVEDTFSTPTTENKTSPVEIPVEINEIVDEPDESPVDPAKLERESQIIRAVFGKQHIPKSEETIAPKPEQPAPISAPKTFYRDSYGNLQEASGFQKFGLVAIGVLGGVLGALFGSGDAGGSEWQPEPYPPEPSPAPTPKTITPAPPPQQQQQQQQQQKEELFPWRPFLPKPIVGCVIVGEDKFAVSMSYKCEFCGTVQPGAFGVPKSLQPSSGGSYMNSGFMCHKCKRRVDVRWEAP